MENSCEQPENLQLNPPVRESRTRKQGIVNGLTTDYQLPITKYCLLSIHKF
ncbi:MULTISPECIES: hypothetical protein [Chroococcidiopsis]|uniref:hypothetical protein n=1 Tax=Chroococcidiopsis TaxID=54298 RepID=UPI0013158286|nr:MULTISPECIES: hypothetical protein [Chroococcidiopsis]URD50404.1 hypothetical protein M5J74_00040 [Chroococcidiopsis sp. CCNUC1]